ncbi:MAG: hypothetical protein KC423_00890 [Anaerolineales bacterium]|nr:hypothetical protein [Anaerolineales bacterium]
MSDVSLNTIVLYEHKNFSESGRKRIIAVTKYASQSKHSLHTQDFKDCLSSLKWNLEEGVVVEFYEHHDGGGRVYQCYGKNEDSDTHNNNFGDCASSWSWWRYSD